MWVEVVLIDFLVEVFQLLLVDFSQKIDTDMMRWGRLLAEGNAHLFLRRRGILLKLWWEPFSDSQALQWLSHVFSCVNNRRNRDWWSWCKNFVWLLRLHSKCRKFILIQSLTLATLVDVVSGRWVWVSGLPHSQFSFSSLTVQSKNQESFIFIIIIYFKINNLWRMKFTFFL